MKPLIIPTQVTEIERRRCGIYVLWDNTKHRVYVGQTAITFRSRWVGHETFLQSEYGTNHLKNSFKKYGKENFEWDIIETLPSYIEWLWYDLLNTEQYERDKNEKKYEPILQWLDDRETYWIAFYRKLLGIENVYNVQDGGRKGTRKFHPYDENTRNKQSDSAVKRFRKSGEREKQSKRISNYFERLFAIPEEKNNFSKKRSEQSKKNYENDPTLGQRIGESITRSYKENPIHSENMSKAQLIAQGRQEVRDKKSKSMTGIEWSEEALENRAKGIHESWKNRHEMLNEVLHLPIQINPRIKYLSVFIKQMMIAKIVECLVFHKYTLLNIENIYQIMDECNILKARYTRKEFNEKIDFNTYFVIKQYT